jgi:cytochrome b561
MMWRNRPTAYGLVAMTLHWLVTVVVIGLFALGLWMVELTYYDDWYRTAPNLHKGIGVTLFLALVGRVLWRLYDPPPPPEPGLGSVERRIAAVVHGLLYVLLFAVMLSGYLISTADGRPIDIFGLFQVPATLRDLPNQADLAGDIHLALAIAVIALASLHVLAALKHHLVDRDRTLLRMIGRGGPAPDPQTHQPLRQEDSV